MQEATIDLSRVDGVTFDETNQTLTFSIKDTGGLTHPLGYLTVKTDYGDGKKIKDKTYYLFVSETGVLGHERID